MLVAPPFVLVSMVTQTEAGDRPLKPINIIKSKVDMIGYTDRGR